MKVVGYAERETMKLTRDVSLARASADQSGHSHASPAGGAHMNRIVTSQCTTRAAMGVLNLLVSTALPEIHLKETTHGRLDMTTLLNINTSSFASSWITTGTVLAIPSKWPRADSDTSAGNTLVAAVLPNTFWKRDAATVTLEVVNCCLVTPAK